MRAIAMEAPAGACWKQKPTMGTWPERYAKIDGTSLNFYDNESDTRARGSSIKDVRGCDVCRGLERFTLGGTQFLVTLERRGHETLVDLDDGGISKFCFKEEAERDRFAVALEHLAAGRRWDGTSEEAWETVELGRLLPEPQPKPRLQTESQTNLQTRRGVQPPVNPDGPPEVRCKKREGSIYWTWENRLLKIEGWALNVYAGGAGGVKEKSSIKDVRCCALRHHPPPTTTSSSPRRDEAHILELSRSGQPKTLQCKEISDDVTSFIFDIAASDDTQKFQDALYNLVSGLPWDLQPSE
jgi:hypothetical protein